MQRRSDDAWGVLGNVAVPPQLLAQLTELVLSRGELSPKRLQQDEVVLRADTTSFKDLCGTVYDRVDHLSFECCTLTDCFVSSEERVDALSWSTRERVELGNDLETTFFFKS